MNDNYLLLIHFLLFCTLNCCTYVFFFSLQFHYFKGESAAFFVEGSKVAEAMKKVSHKITVRDGSKVHVYFNQEGP